MQLRDKVVLITGAGGGIGRATALRFAAQGAKVVAADIAEDRVRATNSLIGGDAFCLRTDVTSWDDTERLVQEVIKRFGHIDILFNSAGIYRASATTVVDTAESDWEATLGVNLKGVFLCIRHVLTVMMEQRSGVIINMSSRAGIGARPHMAAYCTAKAGVVALTRQLAVDYGAYNIRVNCICPAALEHPMGGVPAVSKVELAAHQTHLVEDIPLDRLCTVNDVADAALYLASDAAHHVTGATLFLDGGSLAL